MFRSLETQNLQNRFSQTQIWKYFTLKFIMQKYSIGMSSENNLLWRLSSQQKSFELIQWNQWQTIDFFAYFTSESYRSLQTSQFLECIKMLFEKLCYLKLLISCWNFLCSKLGNAVIQAWSLFKLLYGV